MRTLNNICFKYLGRPRFVRPQRASVTVEDYDLSVRFKCHADGEPPLKYQWLKDGKVLKYRLQKKKYVRFLQIVG